jgi:hypothetical protein
MPFLATKPTTVIPERITRIHGGYKPLAWISELLSLKDRVEEATPTAAYVNLSSPKLGYNAAVVNVYRKWKQITMTREETREQRPALKGQQNPSAAQEVHTGLNSWLTSWKGNTGFN